MRFLRRRRRWLSAVVQWDDAEIGTAIIPEQVLKRGGNIVIRFEPNTKFQLNRDTLTAQDYHPFVQASFLRVAFREKPPE